MNTHPHHKGTYHYPRYGIHINHSISHLRKILVSLAVPILITLIAGASVGIPLVLLPSSSTFEVILRATGATLVRILVAYIASVTVAVPLALWVTKTARRERVFLPILDIFESIPILAFFPVIILVFIRGHFLEGAAFFVLTISMLWSIVFAVVGGIKLIPEPITDFAQVFKVRGWRYFRQILLPAMFPELVTGSILAVAEGWNIIIVAEVLHTYVAGGGSSLDLFGLGSLMVGASANGERSLFLFAVLAMLMVIALLNVFVWQRLLRASEKYKFD